MSQPARRRHYRVRIDQSARLSVALRRGEQLSRRFTARDVSAGGVSFVVNASELPWIGPGDLADIEIGLPERPEPIVCCGRVLRREPTVSEGGAGVPGSPQDALALAFVNPEKLFSQLDRAAWDYFNRRAQRRADLAPTGALARLIWPESSLRLPLLDLSLGGVSALWRPSDPELPGLRARLRLGFDLKGEEGPMGFEVELIHRTPRGSLAKLGFAFLPARSPRFHAQTVPIGRILVRRELGARSG